METQIRHLWISKGSKRSLPGTWVVTYGNDFCSHLLQCEGLNWRPCMCLGGCLPLCYNSVLEKKMLTEVPRTLPLIDFKRIKRCLCFQNVMENIHFCYLCTEKHSRIRLFSWTNKWNWSFSHDESNLSGGCFCKRRLYTCLVWCSSNCNTVTMSLF